MNPSIHPESPSEAMADVPGVCELPLTRAVVQYRDVHELEFSGGRIQDIGLAVVLEGRYASTAEVLDLGSGDVKSLDLSAELVVLDWIYEPTLEHVHGLLGAAAEAGSDGEARRELERFCGRLGMQVLERVGFGPLTRPILLRIGFRDICRDLDLHEGTSVRIRLGGGRVVRVHLDYDGNALVFRTPSGGADPVLEDALAQAFPKGDLRRTLTERAEAPGSGYQLRLALPLTLEETRGELSAIRRGLVRLVSRFEPGRYRSVEHLVETFGQRETLARLKLRRSRIRYATVPRASDGTVH